ncbi:MAG: hypothetical protein WB992_21870 [Bryobacteraceae bacterium]
MRPRAVPRDNAWRLDRVPGLIMAIFAQGRIQFVNDFGQEPPSVRPSLIEFRTYATYEKQLRNIQLQEGRLQRQREKIPTSWKGCKKSAIRKKPATWTLPQSST